MINSVTYINRMIDSDPNAFVNECQQLYNDRLSDLVCRVSENKSVKIILIAGPSASGKTTSSHIFRDMLKEKGINARIISLDNFFLNRCDLPTDEHGKTDYESVYALDLPEIDRCFSLLVETGKCVVPVFDFNKSGRSEEVRNIQLGENGVLIVEGLHALNPLVSKALPADCVMKVYISVASGVKKDNGETLLSGEQIRFCRRMSRDSIYRNSSPYNTLQMWRAVIEGERKWIDPFKSNADYSVDTFHLFEPCLFSERVGEMIKELSNSIYDTMYVAKISDALDNFYEMTADFVPQDSLIREFIEGGKYESET